MSKLPLVEGVLNYVKENYTSFCMPGHKGGLGFLQTQYGKELYDSFIKGDTTEVYGLDNLHKPEGIIKEAMDLLAGAYGSKKSYFLVNGSTSGNLAMIFSTFDEGDKIIVERNCHRSIFNGIIMRKLKPIFIKNKIDYKYNAPLSIDKEHFLQLVSEHDSIKGVLITYPNYYGVCTDLKFIIEECKKRSVKVLVDSAHGAHFGFCKDLPESAVRLGADMVVMSAHKTLPSLTQTAFLHVNNEKDISKTDFYVSSFLSTSPSYMFLSSMDYARYWLEYNGEKAYGELVSLAEEYRSRINSIEHIHVLEESDIRLSSDQPGEKLVVMDKSRYVLSLEKGYSGFKLMEYLRENSILAEMSDDTNIVLIISPFNKRADFDKLYQVLKNCSFEDLKKDRKPIIESKIPEAALPPFEVLNCDKDDIDIEESLGRICAESVVPYPPGIPLIVLGEVVNRDVINAAKYYLSCGITILGVKDKKITVVKKS